MTMNKKLLSCALLGALGFAQAAVAQEYDDRWYVSGDFGAVMFDDARNLERPAFYRIGVGKWFAPNWSWEVDLNTTNPHFANNFNNNLNWSMYGLGLTGRRHFKSDERNWWPFISFGVGALRHEEEFSNRVGGRPLDREGTELEAHAGIGLQADMGRVDWRLELGGRFDFDDRSRFDDSGFLDYIASVGVNVAIGPEPTAPVAPVEPPAQPPVDCSTLDDDGDGVNNCNDKCPNSTAGQTIGPDGCPVPVTIDLRGVNFDFDKDALRPDAVAILTEAVSILTQYPDLRVEVAGHTDLCGSDDYNQGLSQRRAQAVYDYLTSNGVDAGRLVGPNGFGESRPLESTPNTFPACKSETNRRTELNVQN
jgi:OOP family OmpA-OmpF porin